MTAPARRRLSVARKYLHITSFLTGYPYFVLVQNLSFYSFVLLIYNAWQLQGRILKIATVMSVLACLFMAAAIISVISAWFNFGNEYFMISLAALPNYLYWGIIIVSLPNIIYKVSAVNSVSKYIALGLLLTNLSFHFLDVYLQYIPIHRQMQQNAFAFLNIIFAPVCTSYVQQRYNKTWLTLLLIALLSLSGLASGSRSASFLVTLGALTSLFATNIRFIMASFFFLLYIAIFLPIIIETDLVKQNIKEINPRTYEVIYNSQNTFETDQSYLVRLAMIEKGLLIFKENPITGVGLLNFYSVDVEMPLEFTGGELIEHQDLSKVNPHNSYISFLAEGGLLLLGAFVLLILYPLVFFLRNFSRLSPLERSYFIGIAGMAVHSYVIAGMVNIYGWFLLAIANSIIYKTKLTHRQLV